MLSYQDVMDVVRHLVQVPALYTMCKYELKDSCFHIPVGGVYEDIQEINELPLLYIWQGLKKFYEDNGTEESPSRDALEEYIKGVLRSGVYQTPELLDRLFTQDPRNGFVTYMYLPVKGALSVNTGIPLLRQFLKERRITEKVSKLLSFSSMQDKQWERSLKTLTDDLTRVDSLGITYTPSSLVPTQDYVDGISEEYSLRSTGIDYLDSGLGGGQRPGEVDAVIGCTGAGKTTFGVQLAVCSFQQALLEAKEGENPALTVYYTYEQSGDDLVSRFISTGASISRDEVALTAGTYRGIKNASTDPMRPKPYELELWPESEYRESEVQRLDAFARLSERTLIIRNFSGVSDLNDSPERARIKEGRGMGGVPELVQDLTYLSEYYHAKIRTVIIDYTGPMLKRMPSVANGGDQAYQYALGELGDLCRHQIAGRFKCGVWIMHQVSGVGNMKSPGYRPCLADASGCKLFAANMQNAVLLGRPDKGNHENGGGPCLYMVMDKHRNSARADIHEGIIVQHDRYFVRLNNVTNEFYWTQAGNKDKFRYRGMR